MLLEIKSSQFQPAMFEGYMLELSGRCFWSLPVIFA
jgi:hypothetical protein